MSSDDQTLVDFSALSEMLYGEEKFINEFTEAAVTSFSEFSMHYKKFLLSRDEENFRKTGHKIKPVAQMLGLQQIVDEYEHAKKLLWDEAPQDELERSVEKIHQICTKVLAELKDKK